MKDKCPCKVRCKSCKCEKFVRSNPKSTRDVVMELSHFYIATNKHDPLIDSNSITRNNIEFFPIGKTDSQLFYIGTDNNTLYKLAINKNDSHSENDTITEVNNLQTEPLGHF